jgi:serine/threonine-protein kinase
LEDDAESRARARVGHVLDDKWTLERLLGVGGMAAVYAARHRNAARAAVKLLHPDLARHKEVRERFCREGYAANRVEHQGAVKVLDDGVVGSGPDAGTAYIVMELLEGQSMQDRLERGPPMGETEFLELAGDVLDVLQAAHGRSVVHRDLKPENLFLLRPEAAAGGVRVKVLDFGLARLLDGQAITTYGLALGTPSFMSPEQASGRIDEIDGRTDLFALAATGFRLRTGRRIHEAPNAIELVRKMASLAAPRIRTVAADVSEPYARVIDRALEFRREHRYEGAAEMKDDVRKAIAEIEAGTGPTRVAVRGGVGEDSDGREPTTLELEGRRPEGRAARGQPAASETSSADGVLGGRSAADDASASAVKKPRRRRSFLVWVTLLVFAGIAGRLWLDAHPEQSPFMTRENAAPSAAASGEGIPPLPSASTAEAPSPTASAAPAVSAASASPATSTAVAPSAATPAGSAPLSALPRPSPAATRSAAPTHGSTPAKVGPGNVHKILPRKRRTTGSAPR